MLGAVDADAAGFLGDGGLVPAGILPVRGAHVDVSVDDERPGLGGSAVGGPVFTEWRDEQVVVVLDVRELVVRSTRS